MDTTYFSETFKGTGLAEANPYERESAIRSIEYKKKHSDELN